MTFLWFISCVGVIGYGVSNGAVVTLGLPRWTSLAVVALGFCMLMALFTMMMFAAANDISWFNTGDFNGRGGGGGGGD
jgi:hypothetical protein